MAQAGGLTAAQRQDWDRDGYLVLPQFFGADIVDPINALVESLLDPRVRPPQLGKRIVVDLLTGDHAGKRVRLDEAPPAALNAGPVKFNDLILESDTIRACNLDPQLVAILDDLLDGAPVACNSLNFVRGSEQTAHVDSWFMPPPQPDKMVVTSVCLEDVREDAGPLFYYPGSQKIPPYRFSDGRLNAIDAEMPQCIAYVEGEIKARGLSRDTFLGRKGDVFIWSCHLAHGGMPIKNPQRTRRSLVTHYWRAADMPRRKLEPHGPGAYYFARHHQPVPTDPFWTRAAHRLRLEGKWALRQLKGTRAG